MSVTGTNRAVILMTACVCPNGTAYTALQDPQIRKKQYLDAIDFYLRETDLDIVFCENSGTDLWAEISSPEKEKRLEFLTFCGNDYDKSFGKGYGEARIIRYAIENSLFLKTADFIIKITGRVKVLNLNELTLALPQNDKNILKIDFSSDVGRISSVCFLATKSWLLRMIEKYGEEIRDDGEINFEGALFKSIVDDQSLRIIRFNPLLEGISAGFNVPYRNRTTLEHKCCHYRTLCSIYKERKALCHFALSLVIWGWFSIQHMLLGVLPTAKRAD